MKIKVLKELCLRELKNSFENNDYSNESFAENFFLEKQKNIYYNEIELDITFPKLKISNNPKYDCENSKLIFEKITSNLCKRRNILDIFNSFWILGLYEWKMV